MIAHGHGMHDLMGDQDHRPDALRTFDRGVSLVTIGLELTEHTRMGLIDNRLSMTRAHPITGLAISVMQGDTAAGNNLAKRMLNFDIYVLENL
jgi:hypothetical protein